MLRSNFVKYGQREIGKVCYLSDKKIAWLSSSRYCGYGAQNLLRLTTDNVLEVFQISSKSVHFRRSYTRMREHRQSALESESNIRLSFEPIIIGHREQGFR